MEGNPEEFAVYFRNLKKAFLFAECSFYKR